MTDQATLDVRELPRAGRHALVVELFDALAPGDGLVLVNDHDPKPLRQQLETKRPARFTWEYLEQGPEVWRVRIGRPGV